MNWQNFEKIEACSYEKEQLEPQDERNLLVHFGRFGKRELLCEAYINDWCVAFEREFDGNHHGYSYGDTRMWEWRWYLFTAKVIALGLTCFSGKVRALCVSGWVALFTCRVSKWNLDDKLKLEAIEFSEF